MAELRTAHTAGLDPAVREAARALLDEAFHGDVTEADWEHALGGVHALVWDGPALIGHGSVIQRRIVSCPGMVWRSPRQQKMRGLPGIETAYTAFLTRRKAS